jgi:hypothetical protein
MPFVASSIVLGTLGRVQFIAVYEINAHVGQSEQINSIGTANNSNSITSSTATANINAITNQFITVVNALMFLH